MAARPKAKQSKSTAAGARRSTSKAAKKPSAAELLRERDALLRQLQAAEHRISELEELNKEAVNHIDWVIDSLQTVLAENR